MLLPIAQWVILLRDFSPNTYLLSVATVQNLIELNNLNNFSYKNRHNVNQSQAFYKLFFKNIIKHSGFP